MSVDVRELSFQAHKARNAAKRDGGSLLIVDGQIHALDYEIGRPMTMGTLHDLDLTFSAQGVSRHHAKLHCYGRRWAVEDNSKNGTLVRRPSQPRPRLIHHGRFDLEHADMFRCVGGPWVRFETYDQEGTLRVAENLGADVSVSLDDLTNRERQVVAEYLARWLVGEDCSDAALSRVLHVSDETVKTHMSNIRRKWDCRTRQDIVRRALDAGLLPEPRHA